MTRTQKITAGAVFFILVIGLALYLKPKQFSFTDAQERPVVLLPQKDMDPYRGIKRVLGSGPESPDDVPSEGSPHITQEFDRSLGRYVFVFHLHKKNDTQLYDQHHVKFPYQRLEIKTKPNADTSDYLTTGKGETATYRWLFQLPKGFQPTDPFTYVHQLKVYDGENDVPLIAFAVHRGRPEELQVIHQDSARKLTVLKAVPLAEVAGVWLEAYERVTYGEKGRYSVVVSRVADGKPLFAFSGEGLDLWRRGTTRMRPKWGLYRGMEHPQQARDEEVRFGGFCLAKGGDDCPPSVFAK